MTHKQHLNSNSHASLIPISLAFAATYRQQLDLSERDDLNHTAAAHGPQAGPRSRSDSAGVTQTTCTQSLPLNRKPRGAAISVQCKCNKARKAEG